MSTRVTSDIAYGGRLLSKALLLALLASVALFALSGCTRATMLAHAGDAHAYAEAMADASADEPPGVFVSNLGEESDAWRVTLEERLEYAEGKYHTVSVTFDEDSGIPSDAALSLQTVDATEERRKSLHDSLQLNNGEVVVFDTIIRVALTTADGREIQPVGPVDVVIDTEQIPPAQSDAIEVVGLSKNTEGGGNAVLPVCNLTGQEGDGETPNPQFARIQLTCGQLGELGLAVVGYPIQVLEGDGEALTIYAPRAGVATYGVTDEGGPIAAAEDSAGIAAADEDGSTIVADDRKDEVLYEPYDGELFDNKSLLGFFTLNPAASHSWASAMWVATSFAEDYDKDLGGMVLCRMEDGEPREELFDNRGVAQPIAISTSDAYALLWDSTPQVSDEGQDGNDAPEASPEEGATSPEDAEIHPEAHPQDEIEGGDKRIDPVTQETCVASDNETYRVTAQPVGSDPLPHGAELTVSEVVQGGLGYLEYVAQSAKALGIATESVLYARPFDIALVDTLTGVECEPAQGVAVGIELLDAEFDGGTKLDVVHIRDDVAGSAEVVTEASDGRSVEFTTDGFSVYVVCGYAQDDVDASIAPNADYITVAFKNGERTLRTLRLLPGEAIGADAIRSGAYKENHTFKGWYRQDTGEQVRATSTFEADTTIRAMYTVTATFEAEGADAVPAPKTMDEGNAIGELPSVSRPGYRFDGWLDKEGQRVTPESVLNGNTTLYASFVEQVTVTFVADGVEEQPAPVSLDKGAQIGTLLPSVQREGHTFRGWLDEQGNKVEATTTFDEDATLAASFVRRVAVTFVADGKEDVVLTLDSDTPVGDRLPGAEKEGCSFKGWFTKDDKQITADSLFEDDATVTARYAVNVTFVVNKDDGTVASSKVVELDRGVAIGNKIVGNPVKPSYRFLGWYPDGVQEPITAKTTFDRHATVVAKFIKRYTIAFTVDGAVFYSDVVDEGDLVDLPLAPAKEKQRFDGWYENETKVTESFEAAGNRTLVAKYIDIQVQTYTVRFFKNETEGEAPYAVQTVEEQKTATTVDAPSRSHYTFDDWYTDAKNQTNETRFIVGATTITQDIDVYAGWTLNPLAYTVRYLEQGTNAELKPSARIVSRAFVPGQTCTETAPGIPGYIVDQGTKTITLDYEDNEIVFYYSKPAGDIQYTVNYVVYNNHEEEVASSVTKTVSASEALVTEAAVSPTVGGYGDYRPIEATKTFALAASNNVFYFEYVGGGVDVAKVVVFHLDMEGDPVKREETAYYEVGSSFAIATDANGFTFDHAEDNVHPGTVSTENYTVAETGADIAIRVYYKTNLTIRARDISKTYDGTQLDDEGGVSSVTVASPGLKEGHTLTGITLDTGGQQDAGVGSNVPSGAVIEGFKPAQGVAGPLVAEMFYNIRYVSGKADIKPVPLTITTLDAARPYDEYALTMTEIRVGIGKEEERTFKGRTTYTVDLVGGDEVKITVTGTQRSPGESRNTFKIDWGGVRSGNYAVANVLGTLTVTKAQIIITAKNEIKAYGAPDPAFSVVVTRMVGGQEVEIPSSLEKWADDQYSLILDDPDNNYSDILSIAITLEQKDDGTYTIGIGDGEAAEDNYDIVYRSGTLSVVTTRVSNDGGKNWEYLFAFDKALEYANGLSGDIIVEMLSDSYPYMLDNGVVFNNPNIASLAIRTADGIGRSTLTRGNTTESLFAWQGIDGNLILQNVVVDGGGADGKSSAVPGGIVAVADRGTLTLSNGVTLRNSKSEAGGGAIYAAGGSANVVIDGDTCEIINCSAVGNGGALFMDGNGGAEPPSAALTLKAGKILGCTAAKGGAIYQSAAARIDLPQGSTFAIQSCASTLEGGGIYQGGTIGMDGGEIANCSAGTDGGGIYQAANSLTIGGGNIVGCVAGGNGGGMCVDGDSSAAFSGGTIDACHAANGGGVYVAPGNMFVMSGGSVAGNQAGEGAGVYAGGDAVDEKPTIVVTGGVVSANVATGSGGGMYLGRGRSATLSGFTMQGNRATATTAHNLEEQNGTGAALHVDDLANAVLRDGTLSENDAYRAGGGLYVGGGRVSLHNMTVSGNVAGCGGGIGAVRQSGVAIDENTRIVSNNAVRRDSPKAGSATIWHAGNGGGIGFLGVGNEGVLNVAGCGIAKNTAENLGGGVFLDGGNPNCVISGSSFTDNVAVLGGGGYVGAVTLKNGVTIANNTAEDTAAGLHVGTRLTLGELDGAGETTTISNNHTKQGTDSNLCLARVGEGAGTPAVNAYNNGGSFDCIELLCPFVGKVYVSNPGDPGTQFGVSGSKDYLAGPASADASANVLLEEARIATDDGSGLIGRADGDDTGEVVLRWWKQPVCKITDGSGALLYTKETVGEDGGSADIYSPAVYTKLYNAHGYNLNSTAFGVLNDLQIRFYTKSGEAYNEYTGDAYCVKMLDDYTIYAPVAVAVNGRAITFTTAEAKAAKVDDYYYRGQYNDTAKVDRAKIFLNNSHGSMFQLAKNSRVIIKAVTLDGGAKFDEDGGMDGANSVVEQGRGVLASLRDNAKLTLGYGVTLQNAYTEASGGAICHDNSVGTELVVEDGARIYHCGANVSGGAVACYSTGGGAKTTVHEGAIIEECWAHGNGGAVYMEGTHKATMGGTIANCRADGNGGAVCMAGESSGLTLVGGTIAGCTAGNGGGVYLGGADGAAGARLAMGGTLKFADNGVRDWSYAGATNGKESVYDEGMVRQDIYARASDGTPDESIRLTGNIVADAGSIWVWVESGQHSMDGQQFAVADDGVDTSCYKAFRNAKADVETNNDSLGYLTGVAGETEKGERKDWVYWGSSRPSVRVVLYKVDKDGTTALDGAGFALYKENDGADGAIAFRGAQKRVEPVRAITVSGRGASLDLEFGGTYYLEETAAPQGYALKQGAYIQVAVDSKGYVTVVTDDVWQEDDVTYEKTDEREVELTVKNEKLVQKVTMLKVDKDSGVLLDGAEFELYRKDGESEDALLSLGGVTVSSAGASVDLEFGGTYYLKETKAPEGCALVSDGYIRLAVDIAGVVAMEADEPWQEVGVTYQDIVGEQQGLLRIGNARVALPVKFRKVDSFGEPLKDAATFALYSSYEGARANGEVQAVMVNDNEVRAVSSATASNDERNIRVGDVNFEVGKGIYYMRETAAPTGYEKNEDIYMLLVGGENLDGTTWAASGAEGVLQNITPTHIAAQIAGNAGEYAVFLIDKTGKAVATPDIATYGIRNDSAAKRQVVLRKVELADGRRTPLPGAEFKILRCDQSEVASVSSYGSDGIFWIGDLPYGTYYIHETKVPNGYDAQSDGTNRFKLTVTDEAVTCELDETAAKTS